MNIQNTEKGNGMLNKICIIGRLGKDLELRKTQNGTSVVSFDLAVDRNAKEQDGTKVTDWIACVAWQNRAEYLAKYASKGDMLAVEGRLEGRKWKDKNGQSRTSWEIIVDSSYLIGQRGRQEEIGGNGGYGGYGNSGYSNGQQFSEAMDEDDGKVPF